MRANSVRRWRMTFSGLGNRTVQSQTPSAASAATNTMRKTIFIRWLCQQSGCAAPGQTCVLPTTWSDPGQFREALADDFLRIGEQNRPKPDAQRLTELA